MTYRFGPFELDTRAGELRCNEERIPVTPKVFQLLLFLVENRGRLISKREILDRVWGDTHVEEGSVTRTIASLRSALNDKPSRPLYVRTEARRGVRFLADVEEASPDPPSSIFEVVEGGRRYALIEGDNVLGRADDCEVSLKLASISRRHAVITVERSRAVLRDLRSKNGTFVQGRRIDAAVHLHDGNEIRLGSVALSFRLAGGDASTITEKSDRGGAGA